MTIYPKTKRDANGLIVVQGAQLSKISATPITSADLGNTDPAMAKDLIAKNPTLSPGVFAALNNYRVTGANPIAQNFATIDKQTKDARNANELKVAQEKSSSAFSKTPFGLAWTGIKALTRTALLPFTTVTEIADLTARRVAQTASLAKDTLTGKNNYTEQQKNKIASDVMNPLRSLDELTIFQIGKELVTKGKIDVGSGFFISESQGAGFRAREAQKQVFNIPFRDSNGDILKDKNGAIVSRPYGIGTPISWIFSGGHPENKVGIVTDAIAEMIITWKLDPVNALLKVQRSKKLLDDAERTTKGVQSARNVIARDELQKQHTSLVQQVEAASNDLLGSVTERLKGGAKFAISTEGVATVKTKAKNIDEARANLQKLMDEEVRVKDALGNSTFNPDAIANFLSKKSLEPFLDQIADLKDPAEIWRASKNKLDITIAKELAETSTREEALQVLARHLVGADAAVENISGVKNAGLSLNALGRDTLLTKAVQDTAILKAVKGATPPVIKALTGSAATTFKNNKFVKKVVENYNTILPNGAIVHKNDIASLAWTAENIMISGKVPLAERNKIINEIINAADPGVAGYAASVGSYKAIFAANKSGMSEKMLAEFTKRTTFFDKQKDKKSIYWASRQVDNTGIEVMQYNGKSMRLTGVTLDSEFLNNHIYFPAINDILSLISKPGKLTQGKTEKLNTFVVDKLIGNWWKKSVLVRPAYIVRNIMEEQFRVHMGGHVSFYNNPLTAIGMVLGSPNGNAFRKLLSALDPVKNTVYNKGFARGLSQEAAAAQAADAWVAFSVGQNFGASTEFSSKLISKMDYEAQAFGSTHWWDGFASQLRILHSSPIAKKVAQTDPKNLQDVDKTVKYFFEGAGKDTWKSFIEGAVESNQKADWYTEEVIRAFLFTGKDSKTGKLTSLNDRIEELSSGLSGIRNLIQTGQFQSGNIFVKIPNATDIALHNINFSKGKATVDANAAFGETLKKTFGKSGKWDDVLITVPRSTIMTTGKKNEQKSIIDQFFDISTKLEKTTTMGPEWRMQYWTTVRNYVDLLDKKAVDALQGKVFDDLGNIVSDTGSFVGKKHSAFNAVKNAKGDGPVTLDQIHAIASEEAGKHVANLFYNASQKQLLFHQLRLVMPFGQAWGDTLLAWGKLSVDNPDKLYTVLRAVDWLTKPESSAIYQMTDAADFYDPNQGFFYNDPTYNQRRFFIPYAALPLNIVSNLRTGKGFSTEGPYAASSDPMSINFALQGSGIMPGVGPGITVSTEVLNNLGMNPIKLLPSSWQKAVNKVLYPYGEPDLAAKGLIEGGFLSNNFARILGGASKNEESYANSFAPVMSYLSLSGDYNMDNPEDQGRLVKDTHTFAQWFNIMRGFTGLLNPSPMIPTQIVKDKTGDTQLQSALYNDYAQLKLEYVDNNRATAEFLNLYGPEAVFSIIGKTSGGPTNAFTYELIQKYPNVADTYKDTFGYFYPGGGLSQEMVAWDKKKGLKKFLTPSEIVDKSTNMRYYAAKDRLMARSAAEGWDSDRYNAALKSLTTSFNIVGRKVTSDFTKKDRQLAQFKQAINDPIFNSSDAVDGLRDYLYLRDSALEAAGKPLDGTLKSKGTINQRTWLAAQASDIIARNPEFQKIFYNYFKNELDVK